MRKQLVEKKRERENCDCLCSNFGIARERSLTKHPLSFSTNSFSSLGAIQKSCCVDTQNNTPYEITTPFKKEKRESERERA